MADLRRKVPQNVPGEFFVDATCIDCDTCRQVARAVFAEGAQTAYVHRQPVTADERRDALRALVSCPTGSIGGGAPGEAADAMDDFPLAVAGPVFYCGFNSPRSFGGNSYFVADPAGNWLIDSPKFLPRLARRFEQLGGISHIFLTHEDDVADAAKYARHFGSRRIIHRDELDAQPGAETVLDGVEPCELAPGFVAIPTPGHTRGHMVLLVDGRFLFTGDHLSWDRDEQRLMAFRDYCWHSWTEQTESMRRLAEHRFEWILPGHGQRVRLDADEMRQEMRTLVAKMEATAAA
jgi:glyoxylase-like metal-dependent hydrolase (beta-lactamase superfamily II)/ferredoxin